MTHFEAAERQQLRVAPGEITHGSVERRGIPVSDEENTYAEA
jgi:hypothetical protein